MSARRSTATVSTPAARRRRGPGRRLLDALPTLSAPHSGRSRTITPSCFSRTVQPSAWPTPSRVWPPTPAWRSVPGRGSPIACGTAFDHLPWQRLSHHHSPGSGTRSCSMLPTTSCAGTRFAHFLVPAARFWDDIEYLSQHLRLPVGGRADGSPARQGLTPGAIVGPQTLYDLGRRAPPACFASGIALDKRQAQDIFHRHGLDGAFWSLG